MATSPRPRRADEAAGSSAQTPNQPPERPTFGVDPRTIRLTKEERQRAAWRKADAARRARIANLPEPLPWTDPDTAHRGLGPGHGGKPVKRHE